MKTLSIITTAYKSENYLDAYFKNITGLSGFGNYEIILVLNDPNEKELEITDRYKKLFPENIRVERVSLETIGASTNRGFRLAISEFVTCADVDDVRTSDSYIRQIGALSAGPDIGYTYGDFVMVPRQGAIDGVLVQTHDFRKEEAVRSSIVGPNHFFRRNLLDKCGYWDEQLKSGADFDFQIRAAFNTDFMKTGGGPLLYYTRYEGSGSASSNERQQIERTVIELRYGIYDKINYKYLPKALEYDIYHVYFDGQRKHISEFVPNYYEFLEKRYKKYFRKGIRRNYFNPGMISKISLGIKYFIKNPIWTVKKIIKKISL